MAIVTGKACIKCGSTDRYASTGICVLCVKAASAAWRKKNPDRARLSGAAWSKANVDKMRAIRADWASRNKDKIRLKDKQRRDKRDKLAEKERRDAYYSENKGVILEKRKVLRKERPELYRAKEAKYRTENKEKITEKRRRYKAKNPEIAKASSSLSSERRRAMNNLDQLFAAFNKEKSDDDK